MGYCISRKENLDKEVRRIIREQIECSVVALSDAAEPVRGVHDARRSVKRIRALLRLIRPGVPNEFFCAHNVGFRDAARLLSPMRDVQVQQKTLKELNIPANTIALTYAQRLSDMQEALRADVAVRRKARLLLAKMQAEIAKWPLHNLSNVIICCGFRNVYKKARRSFKAAFRTQSTVNLHEWRKRTKDLLYSLQVLKQFSSKTMDKMFSRTKQLADHLGADHDLFSIGGSLHDEQLARPREELRRIERRIVKRREKLQRCAFRLGKRIFEEKPGKVERRVAGRLNRFAKT